MLAGVLEARASGRGQVVDAAISDGAAMLATSFFGAIAAGRWSDERGTNVLDSGAPFYDVYECADGRFVSIGPIEARFHRELLGLLGVDPRDYEPHLDRGTWARARELYARTFRTRTQRQWCELLEGTDACFAPVLSFSEAPQHPHLKARGTFVDVDGVVQPAPAPRFSRTPSDTPRTPVDASPETFARSLSGWIDEGRIAHWDAVLHRGTRG